MEVTADQARAALRALAQQLGKALEAMDNGHVSAARFNVDDVKRQLEIACGDRPRQTWH